MTKWQDAHVGSESTITGFRTTEQEKERLEQLRKELRLTSKGQVIRAALDLLEVLNTPNEFLLGGPERVRKVWAEHPEFVERALRKFGGLAEGPEADAGSPGAAPDAGQLVEGKEG
jgi:hypothetical protein